jgi:hypothetical protein
MMMMIADRSSLMRFDIDSQRRDMAEIRKGATWLKPVLIQSALAAGRKKNSSFKTRYHALKGRVGPKKAAVAVAANLLRVVYQMLKDGSYQDLGEPTSPQSGPRRRKPRQSHPRTRLPSGHQAGSVILLSFRSGKSHETHCTTRPRQFPLGSAFGQQIVRHRLLIEARTPPRQCRNATRVSLSKIRSWRAHPFPVKIQPPSAAPVGLHREPICCRNTTYASPLMRPESHFHLSF